MATASHDLLTRCAPIHSRPWPTRRTDGRIIRISAAVVVDSHNRVLVVRKRGTTAFMQPGGKVNAGETSFEALQRDLLEELDVAITASDMRRLGRFVAEAANEPDHWWRPTCLW